MDEPTTQVETPKCTIEVDGAQHKNISQEPMCTTRVDATHIDTPVVSGCNYYILNTDDDNKQDSPTISYKVVKPGESLESAKDHYLCTEFNQLHFLKQANQIIDNADPLDQKVVEKVLQEANLNYMQIIQTLNNAEMLKSVAPWITQWLNDTPVEHIQQELERVGQTMPPQLQQVIVANNATRLLWRKQFQTSLNQKPLETILMCLISMGMVIGDARGESNRIQQEQALIQK
jgi:hypothetical protein